MFPKANVAQVTHSPQPGENRSTAETGQSGWEPVHVPNRLSLDQVHHLLADVGGLVGHAFGEAGNQDEVDGLAGGAR